MPHAKPTPGHTHAMMFILFISGLGLSYVFSATAVLHLIGNPTKSSKLKQQTVSTATPPSHAVPTQVEIMQPVYTSVEIKP